MKMTTKHTYNDANWEWASLFTRNLKNYTLGIAGTVAKSKGNSWVKYEGSNFKNSSKTFKTIRLFYNNANGNCKAAYSLNNEGMQNLKLNPGMEVMESTINAPFDAKSVMFQFNGC